MPSCLLFLLVSFVQGGEAMRVEMKSTSNIHLQPDAPQQENERSTNPHLNLSAGDAQVITANGAPIPSALVGGIEELVGRQQSTVHHSQILFPNFSGHNFTSPTTNASAAVGKKSDPGVEPHTSPPPLILQTPVNPSGRHTGHATRARPGSMEWICFSILVGSSLLPCCCCCPARRRARQTLRQKSEQDILDRELRWVDDDEMSKINIIKEKLASVLVECPEDMTHDISIARFLREHEGDVERAAEFLGKSLSYRIRLLQGRSIVRDFRQAISRDTQVNMNKLPYAEDFLGSCPIRPAVGGTVDDLPIMLAAPKMINVDEFAKTHDSDKLRVFLRAHLEQRSIVLYNLSIQQRRMVKFVDLRDFTDRPMLALLTRGMPLLRQLHELIKEVQDYYPEIIHEVIIFNAPAGRMGVVSMVTWIIGALGMKAKVKLMPMGQAHCEILNRLSARAIFSWMSDAHGDSPMQSWEIAAGSEGYLVRWLTKGQKLVWVVQVQESSISVLHCFISQERHAERRPVVVTKVSTYVASPHRGCLIAQSDGVFWFCVSNSGAWLTAKTVSVSMQQE